MYRCRINAQVDIELFARGQEFFKLLLVRDDVGYSAGEEVGDRV